jgi:hypothetical protein
MLLEGVEPSCGRLPIPPVKAFWQIYVPLALSLPGLAAGIVIVFVCFWAFTSRPRFWTARHDDVIDADRAQRLPLWRLGRSQRAQCGAAGAESCACTAAWWASTN